MSLRIRALFPTYIEPLKIPSEVGYEKAAFNPNPLVFAETPEPAMVITFPKGSIERIILFEESAMYTRLVAGSVARMLKLFQKEKEAAVPRPSVFPTALPAKVVTVLVARSTLRIRG